MAFSNVPGPLKSLYYKNPNNDLIVRNINTQSYIMVAGNLGMAMCAIT